MEVRNINCDEVADALGLEEEINRLDEKRRQLLHQKAELVRQIKAMKQQQTAEIPRDTKLNREVQPSDRLDQKRKSKIENDNATKRICARLDSHVHEKAIVPVNEEVDTFASDQGIQLALILRPQQPGPDVSALMGDSIEDTQTKATGPELHDLENCLEQLERDISILESGVEGICIAERNTYCTEEIRRQYAEGNEAFSEGHDTMESTDEQAAPLQDTVLVFCVSSRAYQRLTKGTQVPGFKTLEQSGIPQLRYHCQETARAQRALKLKAFLVGFEHLITSLSTWSSEDGALGDARIDQNHGIELLAALEGIQKVLISLSCE